MSLATALSALAAGFFIIGLVLIGLAVQGRWRRVRAVSRSLLVSYVTFAALLLIAELGLRYAYTDSGWSFTLAHQNWEDRYWQRNSSGFRDREWSPEDWQGKTTLVILGDSFASGWGVNDPADRFGDVLATQLGEDYAVINYARPGQSTPQQLETLQASPPQNPDIVLLQYFLNDIELASASVSRFWEAEFPDPRTLPWIVRESHLVNFIYWRLYPLASPINTTFEGTYWEWQYETYDNAIIWDVHQQQINDLIDYVESIGAELYVVIFPNMEDPVGSIPYVDRVKFAFADRGYGDDHVMTLYDEVAAWDQSEVVASPRDAHPSAAFHRFVGELLYERFFAGE